MIRNRDNTIPFVTKDGSIIHELYHPGSTPVEGTSVAEAYVEQTLETKRHIHEKSQEVYYILKGRGVMTLGERSFDVKEGDAILIPPGTSHKIKNTGDSGLRILCICTPPYSHDDTILTGSS
ncbi:hypothetical protein CUJ83_13335 [Methanocella sp. CWC-04]|uniref:Cupin type-2 domain-containing protein n=1 Tax=Methanooceanicella nereidis TaxID=2052831 RepID=A0AAP2W5V8_9EURY|nr:cupin domain-containing protein [Methanocella sp. CWC-04]MCD1295980.1 hypothetical protein [Methanocella sp. CWC-04]